LRLTLAPPFLLLSPDGPPALHQVTATMLRRILAASVITCLCLPGTDAFSPALPPQSINAAARRPLRNLWSASAPREQRELRPQAGAALQALSLPRRELLGLIPAGLALLAPGVAWAGGPAGGGTGDPKDKAKIEGMLATLEDIAGKVENSGSWKDMLPVVTKAPFEKGSMEKAFDLAAKGLPENVKRIYGGDGGEWIGLKNEAVDAVDAFSAELTFLSSEVDAGKVPETADLYAYLEKARGKIGAFLKLYSNVSINSTLKGGGYCAYSNSARCDSYDDDVDVKEAMDKGAIYNELRLGGGRTQRK